VGNPIRDLSSLLNEIYKLDAEISDFSGRLQEQLKNGKADICSPEPPLKKP